MILYLSNAPLIKFFTKELLLTIFYLILTAKIPLIVIFVIYQNLSFIFFCECDFATPIWEDLFKIIKQKHDVEFTASNFDKIFQGFWSDVSDLFIFVP